jgi:uncharacterized Fe-S center protein
MENKKKLMNKTMFTAILILYLVILAFLIYLYFTCPGRKSQCIIKKGFTGAASVDTTQATVYFTDNISLQGMEKLLEPYMTQLTGKVGVKVHFGDEGNQYYVKPDIYKDLILELKGTFIETNVLYKGKRRITETHIALAKEHGFGYAPIDIIDSEGETVIPYNGKHFEEVYTGSHLNNYNSLLVISHFKGHGNAGFGGAIKNVGMGLAAIPGKMAIHAGSNPLTSPAKCIKCGRCVAQCPKDAITLNPLVIDLTKCIACGKCVGVCPSGALRIPWGKTGENGFLERLADYAKAISSGRKIIYVNFLTDISPDCDCMGSARKPFVKDIGILVSDDIMAIDAASCDLVDEAYGKHDCFLQIEDVSGRYIFEYGEEIGLGNKNYQLIRE